MMELSQRRAYKLARDAWIESGMERVRPELEAAELRASKAEKRAQDLEAELNLLKQQLIHQNRTE